MHMKHRVKARVDAAQQCTWNAGLRLAL